MFFFITFKTSKERVQPSTALPSSLKEDLKNLFTNRPWIILAIVGIVSFVMFAMQNAAIAYYFKYYIGKEENVQLFNVVGTVALIVALPLSKPLARKFGNRNVFIASSLLSGACFHRPLSAREQRTSSRVYVLNILAKMAYAPAVPLLWTMIADSADYSEWKSGRRATGLVFLRRDFRPESRMGHRRRHRRLAADGFQLHSRRHADRNGPDRHQAAGLRHSGRCSTCPAPCS